MARQRALAPPDPPAAARAPAQPFDTGLATSAVAVVISWLAAAALVVGIAWFTSTLARSSQVPADTLPYALAWSCGSLTALVTSVGSLFVPARRATLLGVAATITATMLAAVAVQV